MWSGIAVVALLLSIPGCGGAPPPATGNASEVKRLGIVYLRFVGSHRGQGPSDRKQLEEFLSTLRPDDLKAMGINNPAEIFKSSRDNKEIVVRYGITVPPPGPGDPTVVAYESEGVNGNRLAVYGTAGVEEISLERLKKLVPDAK